MDIASIVQKMVKVIKDNILLTKGVYAVLGNLIYSVFFFAFTEMLLIEALYFQYYIGSTWQFS